jgi:DNA-binding transcriptional ArsR family regulator
MRSATSSRSDVTFAALADPTRRRVLELLRDTDSMTAGELAAEFPEIARPSVSKHLKILREAGLIAATQTGREWHYELDTTPLADLQATWIATFVPLFDETLQRLKIRTEATTHETAQTRHKRARRPEPAPTRTRR